MYVQSVFRVGGAGKMSDLPVIMEDKITNLIFADIKKSFFVFLSKITLKSHEL